MKHLTAGQYALIAAHLASGKSESDIAKGYGFTATAVRGVAQAEKAREDGLKAQIKIRELVEAMERATFKDATKRRDEMADEEEKAARNRGEQVLSVLQAIDAAERQADDLRAQRTLDRFDLQRYQIGQWLEDEKKRLRESGANWESGLARLEAVAAEKYQAVSDDQEMFFDEEAANVAASKSRWEQWGAGLSNIAGLFQQLAQASDGSLSTVSRNIGSALAAVNTLHGSIDQMSKGGFANFVTGLTGVIGAAGQLVEVGRAVHDALSRSENEKIAADLRRQFQLAAEEGDELTKTVERLMERLRVTRPEALTLSLPQILQQAGGLTAQNLNTFLGRTYELLTLTRRGGELAQEALPPLNTMLGQLGQHLLANGGLFNTQFLQMLREIRDAGLEAHRSGRAPGWPNGPGRVGTHARRRRAARVADRTGAGTAEGNRRAERTPGRSVRV